MEIEERLIRMQGVIIPY